MEPDSAPCAVTLARPTTPGTAPFLVGFRRNARFVGHEAELTRLDALLATSATTLMLPAVITGDRGAGKTQIALEYAHRRCEAYPGGVFWINAAGDGVHGEMARLAVKLGLELECLPESERRMRLAMAFVAYLEEHPRALVIFDGVDAPAKVTREPHFARMLDLGCRVVLTTRHTEWDHGFAAIPVAELLEDQSRALLLSGETRKAAFDASRTEEVAAAADICRMFGGSPIAMALAAAYLEIKPEVSLADYRDRVRAEGGLPILDEGRDEHAPTRALDERQAAGVGAALRLQWSMLSYDGARRLLQTAALIPGPGEIPLDRLELLTRLESRIGPIGPHGRPWSRALNATVQLSLAETTIDDTLRLDPVVRQFVLTTIGASANFAAYPSETLSDRLLDPSMLSELLDPSTLGHGLARGVDSVRGDLRAALQLTDEHTRASMLGLLRALDREAPCLRRWERLTPAKRCGSPLQQIRNRAFELGDLELQARVEAGLDSARIPHLRQRHRTSRDSAALVWTLGESTSTLAITLDGRHSLSQSARNSSLMMWELSSGQAVRSFDGHTGPVTSVAMTPDGLFAVSGSGDGTLRVWELASGHSVRTLQTPPTASPIRGMVTGVAVSPDGRLVISASTDRTLSVWDLENGQVARTLVGHTGSVNCVTVTPDGRFAISGSSDRTVKAWEIATGQLAHTLEGHSAFVYCVIVSPDGQFAYSASEDQTIRAWSLATWQYAYTFAGDTDPWPAVAVTSDGRFALAGSSDKTLNVWHSDYPRASGTLGSTSGWVRSVAVTPDGRFAVSADGRLQVWDLSRRQLVRASAGHEEAIGPHAVSVSSVAVTPDGRFALSASANGRIAKWEIASGRSVTELCGHGREVKGVTVTEDGRTAVSIAMDATLIEWDLTSGLAVRSIALGELPRFWTETACVAVTPDARFVLGACEDKALRMWNLSSGELANTLTGHSDLVCAVAVTPDGRFAVSASVDKTLNVWDLSTGLALRALEGHTGPVRHVVVTRDGRFAISSSMDGTIKVWDLATGQAVRTLDSAADGLAVSPDGRFVFGVSNGTIEVWDLSSGKLLATLAIDGALSCCAVSPNGTTLVAGGEEYGVYVFDLLYPPVAVDG